MNITVGSVGLVVMLNIFLPMVVAMRVSRGASKIWICENLPEQDATGLFSLSGFTTFYNTHGLKLERILTRIQGMIRNILHDQMCSNRRRLTR
jgi:hypothetical protein